MSVETSSLGHVAPSTRRNNGSCPALASNLARALAALMVQPVCGWWQVKHVRPLVPRFWKNGLLAVIVATPGVNVATRPLGSASTSSFGMVGGVACEPWSASLNMRILCAWSIAPGAQSVVWMASMTSIVCADAGGGEPRRQINASPEAEILNAFGNDGRR